MSTCSTSISSFPSPRSQALNPRKLVSPDRERVSGPAAPVRFEIVTMVLVLGRLVVNASVTVILFVKSGIGVSCSGPKSVTGTVRRGTRLKVSSRPSQRS
eukprot:1328880-Rhodomonas_salina.1